ncbi:MAG: nucleotide-binding universal stress UspA family protein [Lentisphaeria bacterium]|jgi:nucleotide-binding universal stress UspA family protein
MIQKILFATDLGVYTPYALTHVESLAQQFDAKICLVHVVPLLSEFTHAVVKSYCSEQVKRELLETKNIKGLLEAVRDEVFEVVASSQVIEDDLLDRISDIIIVPGKAANVILFECERLGADLIVIGNRGSEAIDGRILGSVASKILQLAKVPVYMVPMISSIEARTSVKHSTRSG